MLKEIGKKRMIKYLIFGLWDLVFRAFPYSPLRMLWLKIGGAKVHWSAIIDRVSFMNLDRTGLSGLALGKKSFVGCNVILDLAGHVTIEDVATVSPAVVILSHVSVGFSNHPLVSFYPKKVESTIVKTGAFVGAHATILSGVTIGKNSLVAAGAVVTKDVPDGMMVAGVPAVVKKRIKEEGKRKKE